MGGNRHHRLANLQAPVGRNIQCDGNQRGEDVATVSNAERLNMAGQAWTRVETLVAFNVYCRTLFGRLYKGNAEIIEVAKALGRTPDSLAMKCCNLASFDSALKDRGIKGLSKASRLDAEVWKDFTAHPEEVAFESEQAYANLMQRELRAEREVRWEDVQGLDKSVVTKVISISSAQSFSPATKNDARFVHCRFAPYLSHRISCLGQLTKLAA
jgi:hypothetical protein